MTPQLQQAIRLLQLPIMELQTQIQEALDENVMLEIDETESTAASESPEALRTLAIAPIGDHERSIPIDDQVGRFEAVGIVNCAGSEVAFGDLGETAGGRSQSICHDGSAPLAEKQTFT